MFSCVIYLVATVPPISRDPQHRNFLTKLSFRCTFQSTSNENYGWNETRKHQTFPVFCFLSLKGVRAQLKKFLYFSSQAFGRVLACSVIAVHGMMYYSEQSPSVQFVQFEKLSKSFSNCTNWTGACDMMYETICWTNR